MNKDRVTDDLVQSLMKPSDDPGALGVFVQVYTGDPGPRPEQVAPGLACPIALCWGCARWFAAAALLPSPDVFTLLPATDRWW